MSGRKTKSPIPLSTNLNLGDWSTCKVARPVCSALDPPRFETSVVCIVENNLSMGTGIRDPPVIGKCFISQQERRSTRSDCTKIWTYVEEESEHICFEKYSGIARKILMCGLFVSLLRFLRTQRISIIMLEVHRLLWIKHKAFNLLNPTGYVMHHQFNIQQLYVLPTLYSCVLYLSQNKQRLVPLTA